jgi:DNA-binding IclR family transcriptional regulator
MAAGPLLLRWAATLGPDWNIAELAHGPAHQLAQASGETVGLTIYDPATATAVFAAEALGSAPIEYSLGIGTPIPLYAGAAGKAILAHCPAEVVQNPKVPHGRGH